MQKIIFLFEQKSKVSGYYYYQAADYGPFSWQLASDLEFLKSRGLMMERLRPRRDGGDRYVLKITDKGSDLVKRLVADSRWKKVLEAIEKLKIDYNGKDLTTLLREVYQDYPAYAVRSKANLY
ncbi:MAG: hypothetical protein OK439_00340 [Thaumarchaeota archaeon]|nr:hypothetical protein [Nitrososphaerota archaeon]